MTTLGTFDAAGLTSGAALAAASAGTGDTAVSGVNGGPKVDSTDTPYGQSGERTFISDITGGTQDNAYWNTASTIQACRIRGCFKTPAAWPASAVNNFLSAKAANAGNRFGIGYAGTGNPGQFRLLSSSSTLLASTSNGVLALNTWYWTEFWGNITSSSNVDAGCKLYAIDGTLLSSLTGSGSPSATGIGRIYGGLIVTSPSIKVPLAHLKWTDDIATDIGPWYTAPPTGKKIRRYDGSSEVAQVVRMFNGTSEVPVTLNQAA